MKTVIVRLKSMSEACKFLLKGGLLVACALLLGAAILLFSVDKLCLDTYYVYKCAETMREMAPAVLFIAVFGSAWWEERIRKSGT